MPIRLKGASSKVKADALADQQRWAAFPVIASSPETGQMLGGMLFYFFPVDGPGKQASTIDTMVFGTTKGQYVMQVSPNIFFDSGRYRLNATLNRSIWKANYYGVGADSADIADKYKSSLVAGQPDPGATLQRFIGAGYSGCVRQKQDNATERGLAGDRPCAGLHRRNVQRHGRGRRIRHARQHQFTHRRCRRPVSLCQLHHRIGQRPGLQSAELGLPLLPQDRLGKGFGAGPGWLPFAALMAMCRSVIFLRRTER